jgi:hypothetical protein
MVLVQKLKLEKKKSQRQANTPIAGTLGKLSRAFKELGLLQMTPNNNPGKRATSRMLPASAGGGGVIPFASGSGVASSSRTLNLFPSGNKARLRSSRVEANDEYLAEVNGSVTFSAVQYAVNPGNAVTFPWLSKIAANFERYRFKKLQFYFKPEVSQFATNGQAGKVMLSADYDSSDPPPSSKQIVEATYPHADGMPYETIVLDMDCGEMAGSIPWHFIRTGGVPGGSDIKTYDATQFYISTVANTNTNVVGELRVRYECELDVPQLNSSAFAPNNYVVSQYESAAGEALVTATPTTALLAGTAANFPGTVVDGLGLGQPAAGVLTLPPGNYMMGFNVLFNGSGSVITESGAGWYDITNSRWITNPLANGMSTTHTISSQDDLSATVFYAVKSTISVRLTIEATFASGTVNAYGTAYIAAA